MGSGFAGDGAERLVAVADLGGGACCFEGYPVPPWRQSLTLALIVAIEIVIEACCATAQTLFARASTSSLLSRLHALHSALKAAGRLPLLTHRKGLP